MAGGGAPVAGVSATVDGLAPPTLAFPPEIVPLSAENSNVAGPEEPPEETTNFEVPLNTCPVGPVGRPVLEPGMFTTSGDFVTAPVEWSTV